MPKTKKKVHKKFSWKIAAIIIIGVVAALAITAQVCFDQYMWQQNEQQAAFQMRTLIGEAIKGVTDLKSSPDANNQIPEVRLQLPPETDDVHGVLYLYTKLDDSEDFQVTTKQLSSMATGKLNGGTTMKTLFELVPQTQSCVRGFTLQFKPMKDTGGTYALAGIVNLQDGRTLYVYREPACQIIGVEALEKYLLRVQSY